ncbi:MAG: CehA/McbA family metallohydrolase [Candidatus Bathyarchaeota archaeon]|nr:CehA/McbA family metallohydrolase [Candidatus Bathyarchaeota archaeon]MDH5790592.1 CehA/McbA family metallohydrolase [Candidatus Bathyarchaeota archaeon]
MRLRIDLHVHTVKSGDSYITLEDAIRRCREDGLDGFAVTDHDTMTGIPDRIENESGLIVIPGTEITSSRVHIIAFDIDEEIPKDLSVSEIVDGIHDQGGIAIIAHPYSLFRTWVNPREIEEASFDCVEVANAYQFPYGWMLAKNTDLAERLGLPMTGGSDAHIPRIIGRALTILEAETRDAEGALGALREGRTEATGRGITLSERLKLVRD